MLEAIFTIGLAASGKSSWAQGQNMLVLDSDQLRLELYGDATCQKDPHKIFDLMYKRGKEALKNGISVIFCSTNLTMKYRIHAIKQIKQACPDVHIKAVIFNTPIEICKKNNLKRTRQVPDWLFEKQLKTFQFPVYNEGWDEIEVITPIDYKTDSFTKKVWNDVINIGSQDNPHHSLTLYQHLNKCIEGVKYSSNTDDESFKNLLIAAGVHDIGKAYTRFYDNKGIAHYYSHENVSAYYAMNFHMSIEVCQLVAYHMIPYMDEAAQKTWRARLGEDLWNKIMILHNADEFAH